MRLRVKNHMHGGNGAIVVMLGRKHHAATVFVTAQNKYLGPGKWRYRFKVGVNWGAWGTQSAATARSFAAALLKAADIADQEKGKRAEHIKAAKKYSDDWDKAHELRERKAAEAKS